MLRKSSLKNAFDVKFVQNVTLNANARKIVTLKCIWHQICTKIVTLKANVKEIVTFKVGITLDTSKYVQNHYFKGKC